MYKVSLYLRFLLYLGFRSIYKQTLFTNLSVLLLLTCYLLFVINYSTFIS